MKVNKGSLYLHIISFYKKKKLKTTMLRGSMLETNLQEGYLG